MQEERFISVIIPVYNASKYLEQCLGAVQASSYESFEVIVVDDASTDDSAAIAREHGISVFQLPRQSGPSVARNYGAKNAKGEIFLFIDADVLIYPDTLARVNADFQRHVHIVAVFGSYDDEPAAKNFLSQYKNLFHHFTHQQAHEEASTFWSGCGAIRSHVFQEADGFDQENYPFCIEDIELGYRLKGMGYRIFLDKDLQVKHLKHWTLCSLLRADIFCRAVPWSKLILSSQQEVQDLNIKIKERISTGLVGLSILLVPFAIFTPWIFVAIALLLAFIGMLNRALYAFFVRKKGWIFAVLSFPLHLLYYLYSGATFGLCWGLHMISGKKRKRGEQLHMT